MTPHIAKLQVRRFWRRRKQRAEALVHGAGDQFENNFLARLNRLRKVWRFVVVWMLLITLLGAGVLAQFAALRQYYQIYEPVPGGIYSEGIEGSFTTANPLYAVNDVDTSVAQLLFAGLLTYDGHNHLVGDLADAWSANVAGTLYTVHLRPHLTWQDGQPLTAQDVVFTFQTIQNPDARSPLFSSWQGVKVSASDARTVKFALPNALSSFPYGLTIGIVPRHILQAINPVDLRSSSFNTADPVGAGPFEWSSVGVSGEVDTTETEVNLLPFSHYWAGKPKLTSFTIRAFTDHDALVNAYRNKEITSVVGLESVPDKIIKDISSHVYNVPLTAGVYVFFRMSEPLFSDVKVRKALVYATDQKAVLKALGYAATPVVGPLLTGQVGFEPALAQDGFKPAQASALLDAAGWALGPHGIRQKSGQPLTFNLSVTDNSEYVAAAGLLKKQWRAVGVDVQVIRQADADFQSNLASHSYDAVLYGIAIGADPDVFAYWDSSQADVRAANRLNFSEYKSTAADLALEAGRTRLDPLVRAAKYHAFLQIWQQDTPALGLYQPRLSYISHSPVYGLGGGPINTDAGRFWNVQNWEVHEGWVTRQ